jgi:hypothetical protein
MRENAIGSQGWHPSDGIRVVFGFLTLPVGSEGDVSGVSNRIFPVLRIDILVTVTS